MCTLVDGVLYGEERIGEERERAEERERGEKMREKERLISDIGAGWR